jgi:superfamily II DNA/RNA helicase
MSETVEENFETLGLRTEIVKGVYSYGFINPSDIQTKGIKVINTRKDCILQSQSGTGKTGTYLLGTLQNIDETKKGIQSIIITPTRELAEQVYQVGKELSKYTKIKILLCVGGTNIGSFKKEAKTSHLLIGTIGRIYHMMEENVFNLKDLTQVTLDEADNLLDRVYSEKVLDFIKRLETKTQKCFLSATVNRNLREICKGLLEEPQMVLLKKEEVQVKAIKNFYLNTEKEENKFETLIDLYNLISTSHTMIFCNSINKIEFLKQELEKEGFPITTIHGGLSQEERNKTVQDFRDGKTRILLTTDLLARGIDIPEVKLVINYDLPKSHETFIHRIGRCGRFGKSGVSISFVKMDDFKDKKNFESLKSHYAIKIEETPENISSFLN